MHNVSNPEIPRDRALPFFTSADFEHMAAVLDDMPRFRSKSMNRAAAAILAGMDHHVRMQKTNWISYARAKSHYTGKGMYFGDDYTYSNVVTVVDALAEAGYLSEHERMPPSPRGTGIQSRFIPNAEKFQSVRLPRFRKPTGALIRIRDRGTREMIPYVMNERIDREWKWTARLNEAIADMDIAFSGGIRRDGDVCYFENSAVDLSQQSLYRVFNDNLTLGGRFYGAWWMSVPKLERRQFISIDGQITSEEDYSNQHPKFLYYLVGETLVGDAYDIGEKYRGEWRDPIKRALNILINAKSYSEAVGATAQHVNGSYAVARDIIERLKARHAPISHFFHSDLGVKLQNVDSQMCRKILDTLVIRKGIPCLSVHDSFIVREGDRQILLDTMQEVIENTANPVLDKLKDSKTSSVSVLHNPLSSRSVLPCSSRGGASDSESESESESESKRNRKTIQNRKTSGAKKTITTQNHTVDQCAGLDTQEKRPEKVMEDIRDFRTSIDTANAPERTVAPFSDDCRHDTQVKERPKAAWQPRKTTVPELIREEERRRDARRNGKHTRTGRE
ncbi:hypothetical protein [Sinorhizobium fredii]|uniref:hypothetical protein n=1 Tax=Rhizobium fredii TaxID=380 RepID=UPI0035153278